LINCNLKVGERGLTTFRSLNKRDTNTARHVDKGRVVGANTCDERGGGFRAPVTGGGARIALL